MIKELDEALEELKNIALSDLDSIPATAIPICEKYNEKVMKDLDTIKQYILKAQEQEKKLAYFEKVKTMIRQKDCALRYFESEDCFAVRTIFSNGWYKLTPAFVDENVREEIEPLPIIEKNKKLREENARYKEMLNLIKEKEVELFTLYHSKDVEDYNSHFMNRMYQLTQDEYNSIMEMLKCN